MIYHAGVIKLPLYMSQQLSRLTFVQTVSTNIKLLKH